MKTRTENLNIDHVDKNLDLQLISVISNQNGMKRETKRVQHFDLWN